MAQKRFSLAMVTVEHSIKHHAERQTQWSVLLSGHWAWPKWASGQCPIKVAAIDAAALGPFKK